jgi:hypothetical protein
VNAGVDAIVDDTVTGAEQADDDDELPSDD